MKRLLNCIISFILIFGVCSGCSNSDAKNKNKNSIAESGYEFTTFLPNPEDTFKNGDISEFDGDGGNTYLVQVTNYNDGEYEEYVKKCKDAGFKNVDYETSDSTGKTFGASDKDGEFSISVVLRYNIEAITIACRHSAE